MLSKPICFCPGILFTNSDLWKEMRRFGLTTEILGWAKGLLKRESVRPVATWLKNLNNAKVTLSQLKHCPSNVLCFPILVHNFFFFSQVKPSTTARQFVMPLQILYHHDHVWRLCLPSWWGEATNLSGSTFILILLSLYFILYFYIVYQGCVKGLRD